MTAGTPHDFADRMPLEIEQTASNQLRQIIASQVKDDDTTVLELVTDPGQTATVTLTPAIAHVLLDLLRIIGSGQSVRLVRLDAALTTQQAADLLNVSRPYLIKLLETGTIPFSKTGRHRRIKAEDVFRYKDERDQKRARDLSEMAAEDAALGL